MPTTAELVETLSALNPNECADLSKALEEKWGVSAAVHSVVTTQPQQSTTVVEAQTEFDVRFKSFADTTKKISLIKEVREISKLGLAEAKGFVEKGDFTLLTGVTKEQAEGVRAKLEMLSAVIEIV